MWLNHWVGWVSLTTAAVHILFDFNAFVKPAVAVPLNTDNVSEKVQQAARLFSGKASKKSKSKRKPYKSLRHPGQTAGKREDTYEYDGHEDEHGDYGYAGPEYYPTAAYTQPIYLSGGADYGLGLHKPLLFLLVIPVVLIVVLAAVLSILRASSSSSAASALTQQQQQQQDSNNNNNNNDNNSNNNNAVVVATSTGTTSYTSPFIIIINATGRANEERLVFTRPTWTSEILN